MNTISFMTANYVAREVGFNMTRGWGQGDRAANEYYKPIETFGERLNDMLGIVRSLDFQAIDLWTSHLNPSWATNEHLKIACDVVRKHELRVVSIAGWLGSTPSEFEMACKIATALECPVLGASTSMLEKDRPFVVRTLKKYDLKLGLENHPEKTPEDLLSKIGDGGEGTIGACVDTGHFGTQGYSAARAIEKLDGYLFHIHLKDVLHVGEPHETCRFGQGIVPVEECAQVLKRLNYQGAISIEHEPELYDPSQDCKVGREVVQRWLQQ